MTRFGRSTLVAACLLAGIVAPLTAMQRTPQALSTPAGCEQCCVVEATEHSTCRLETALRSCCGHWQSAPAHTPSNADESAPLPPGNGECPCCSQVSCSVVLVVERHPIGVVGPTASERAKLGELLYAVRFDEPSAPVPRPADSQIG